ncbi:membrane protein involved in D-alanine export [Clostridium algifaecis]|uniref:Teichoic acid D-alanyltransferase n=1 Tax=Clostridium algifaecis TaxID=1472040 RepID=A0ABS4KTC1_9CLOT|nr:D-alanyl-lipoteichoic acid biosynthesis protein DltB [Clostridium algifaecis]MBP2032094.1 membrane protein involved in D-alanine export [Clostridium algifaecis]
MTPFDSSMFFYILFLSLIPAIFLGLLEKKLKYYGTILSLFMIVLFIGINKFQLISFFSFYIWQVILIEGYLKLRKKINNIWVMRLFVFLSILPLCLVKFSHFYTTSTLGFIGISYVTFRTVQIVIETHDGLIKKINLLDLTYFIIFFPSISSGPIDRSRRFEEDINRIIKKQEYLNYMGTGIFKIFKGVAYKFILSSIIYNYWLCKIPSSFSAINILQYMYAYSLYLFFDFAGYSCIAIGTGYFWGVKLPENFNLPFLSKSMKEFWNRWHMSLSFWFRDFIYTRFVMNSMRHKWFKNRYTSSYLGFMVTMVTMGIWHGTYLYYIIYGFYEGILLVATDYYQRKSKFYKAHKKEKWFMALSIFITFNLACFGLLLFSGRLLIYFK